MRNHRFEPMAIGGAAPQIGFEVVDADVAAGKAIGGNDEIVLIPGDRHAVDAEQKRHCETGDHANAPGWRDRSAAPAANDDRLGPTHGFCSVNGMTSSPF